MNTIIRYFTIRKFAPRRQDVNTFDHVIIFIVVRMTVVSNRETTGREATKVLMRSIDAVDDIVGSRMGRESTSSPISGIWLPWKFVLGNSGLVRI